MGKRRRNGKGRRGKLEYREGSYSIYAKGQCRGKSFRTDAMEIYADFDICLTGP